MATADELLDLDGVSQRASEIRFDILDSRLAPIGTVKPDLDPVARVTNNSNAAIKRTLQGMRLNAAEQADVNPLTDRIRPVWVLENGSQYPLGVFLFASMDRARSEWGLDADVSAVDQCLILDQPLERGVGYPGGTPIRDAIVTQFQAVGIHSYNVDPSITSRIGAPIHWPAGNTSRMKVLNDLAAMAGAYSAYFDNDGVGVVRRVPDLSTVVPTLVYEAGGRILHGSPVESDDLLEAPNRYIVVDSGDPNAAIVGYYDVPAAAPNSFANRGFVIARVISEQGIESNAEAITRGRAAAAQDAGTFEWVQFSSPPDPRHDTFDAVGYLGGVYREQQWTLPLLEGSEMTHDLRRVY